MRGVFMLFLLVACGGPPPATPEYEPDGHEGQCLPLVGHCGCSYTCGVSVGVAENGNSQVQTGEGETVEATFERWCQDGDCRNAFVRPLPCGGECVPTRLYDSCAMRNGYCAQSPRDALHSQATEWLAEIAAKQEQYRGEFGQYFPQDPIPAWAPAVLPDGAVWENPGRWVELQFREGDPTPFQFRVWAGGPGDDPPVVPPTRGTDDGSRYWGQRSTGHDFWYVVRARGKIDSQPIIFQRTSWDDRVVIVDAL